MPPEMVGIYYGVGAVVAWGLHHQHEVFVMPNLYEMCLILGLGLSSGLAALLWVFSTQKGNVKLLGVLAYFTPLLSMILLVYCGKEPMSRGLVIASILFICGVLVGCIDWKRIGRSSSSEPVTQN
jgi:EamA domain-containing membrane protein RarD